MAAIVPHWLAHVRARLIASVALTFMLPMGGLAQVRVAARPDTTQAVRWLDSARAALDSSAEDLRIPLALAYARAVRALDALALSHAPGVLAAAACASMTAGDTAASDTTFMLATDEETRGWLLARLARRHLRVWWNKPPTADRVRRAVHVTDRITWPEARVAAELFLAYHLVATAHDTLLAQARVAGTRASYAAITDPVRRAEYASGMAWTEASIGDPSTARHLALTVPQPGDRTWALSQVAVAFRTRGLDPRPVLVEAESLARTRRLPGARARALDAVIMGYDSIADTATIRRLRALRPAPRPPLPPTRLDSALMRLQAGDTAEAERLVRSVPDARRLGYYASALEALGRAYRTTPGTWPRAARLYREAVVEARRIRDASVRISVLQSLAWDQQSLGSDGDTRQLPESRALQDTLLRDAELTAAWLPTDSRVAVFRQLSAAWGTRSLTEARRLLGRLPSYADSAETLKWMAIKSPTAEALEALSNLGSPLARLVVAGVQARRAPTVPDTPRVAARRRMLVTATLPRDTVLVQPLLGSGMIAVDTAWLTAWAARQPTALARAAAYRALGLEALIGGSGWPWFGRSETCLDE